MCFLLIPGNSNFCSERQKFPSIRMLKAGQLSHALTSVSSSIQQSGVCTQAIREGKLFIMLVANDGNLISSSVPSNSPRFDSCQRIAAVASSIAVEYRAVERLMSDEFRAFVLRTEGRIVRCSQFSHMKDGGAVLLVESIEVGSGIDEGLLSVLMDNVSLRLHQDLLPCIGPIMENMISAPPNE